MRIPKLLIIFAFNKEFHKIFKVEDRAQLQTCTKLFLHECIISGTPYHHSITFQNSLIRGYLIFWLQIIREGFNQKRKRLNIPHPPLGSVPSKIFNLERQTRKGPNPIARRRSKGPGVQKSININENKNKSLTLKQVHLFYTMLLHLTIWTR